MLEWARSEVARDARDERDASDEREVDKKVARSRFMVLNL
jgi:hypothetical protein